MGWLDDLKKKTQQGVQTVQNTVNKGREVAGQAVNTVQNIQNGVNAGVQKATMDIRNGVNTAIGVGNAAVNGAINGAVNGAKDGVKEYYGESVAPTTAPTAPTAPSTSTTGTTGTTSGTTGSYVMGETATNAKNALDTHNANSPEAYASNPVYQEQLQGIMDEILNGKKFEWDMNGDAMYNQMRDMYTNQATLGMQNAMGQAAALSGGYGSSYGQMVGQQAYAQQMQGLNDVALDLYDRAYNQYQNDRADLYNQFGMVNSMENQDYSRYMDSVDRYLTDRDYLTGVYNTEAYRDYGQHRDSIDDKRYETEWAASEEQRNWENEWTKQEHESLYGDGGFYETENDKDRELTRSESEKDRELTRTENENDREFNREMADIERSWEEEDWEKMYGDEGYYTKRDEQDQSNWQAEFDAAEEQRGIENEWTQNALDDAEEASNPNTTYEGEGSLSGKTVPKVLAGVPGLTTTNTNLFDENGNFKKAAIVSATDERGNPTSGTPIVGKGTMTYNIGGKEVTLRTGTNPYTNTVNHDAKNGVFSNGYQPDNIGGNKLEKTGKSDVINGTQQNVWQYKTSDGTVHKVVWDGASNQYITYDDETNKNNKPTSDTSSKGVGGGGRLDQTTNLW